MPVLAELTAQERKRGRGWLWLLAAVPVLLVLFLVGTTVRPLVLEMGGRVAILRGEWSGGRGVPESGFYQGAFPPAPGTTTLNERNYVQTGTAYFRYVRLGFWTYGVGWFKGHRQR
jgi:hypothetical protein